MIQSIPNAPPQDQFAFPGCVQAISSARRRIAEFARTIGVNEVDQDDIELAAGEALANAVMHGCRNDDTCEVTVSCRRGGEQLVIEVADPAVGFQFPPQRGNGFGLNVMRAAMDEVEFDLKPGRTTVRLVKRVQEL